MTIKTSILFDYLISQPMTLGRRKTESTAGKHELTVLDLKSVVSDGQGTDTLLFTCIIEHLALGGWKMA